MKIIPDEDGIFSVIFSTLGNINAKEINYRDATTTEMHVLVRSDLQDGLACATDLGGISVISAFKWPISALSTEFPY